MAAHTPMALVLAALLSHVSAALVSSARVTPVAKVVTLLENLKSELEAEGSAEAGTYDKFACFCQETTKTKSTSITTGQDTIDTTSATIEEKTELKAKTSSEVAANQEKQESLDAELKDTVARCAKEKATYEASAADLSKAISGLKGALASMTNSKSASFLAVRKSLRKSLSSVGTLSGSSTRKQRLVADLLGEATVDPTDPEYKFHSQNIIDTVTELLGQFNEEKESVDAEWAKTKKTCDDTKASLTAQLKTTAEEIAAGTKMILELQAGIASSRQELVQAEAVLKDDQLYLKDLTGVCEARAKDWDQRSSMRADEIHALSQALEILSKGVVSQENVNKRALLLERAPRPAGNASAGNSTPSFLQTVNVHISAGSRSLAAADARAGRLAHIAKWLHGEGQRLRSMSLSTVAARATGSPFDKVKELIQQLVERLLKEATAEASKKGFCDTELGKAESDRDARFADAGKLSVTIEVLEAKEDKLTDEISSLTDALAELQKTVSEANSTRVAEKSENMETLKTAKEGVTAVTEALAVLKAFYKQAAKAKVAFAQASPVDEDTTGPGFEGAYKGKQEASAGVLGLLEVIKSDFERTLKKTAAAEKAAAAAYVELERASLADISGKDKKKTLNSEDLATTKSSLAQGLEDLKTQQTLLDTALARLEDLGPTCVDNTMPYEERVQKREEEMEALKTALCILDTEKVEDECSR